MFKRFFHKSDESLSETSKNYQISLAGWLLKGTSFLLSIAILCTLAFPAVFWITGNDRFEAFQWKDIIAIVDVSESMAAMDGGNAQSRLEATKTLLSTIVARNPNNKYGLIAFEAEGKTISPLTTDTGSFASSIGLLSVRMLSKHGSDINSWLTEAARSLHFANNPLVLVFTDSAPEGGYVVPKEFWSVPVSVIGVGSTIGAKIPKGTDIFWAPIYRSYHGEEVTVKLDESSMKKMSDVLSANYIHLTETNETYKKIASIFWDSEQNTNSLLALLAAIAAIIGIIVPYKKKR